MLRPLRRNYMKIRRLLLAFVLLPIVLGCFLPRPLTAAPTDEVARKAITSVLEEQQAAWNRGDVDAFMNGYWHSPDLTFAGISGITRGWESVAARYRKNYADRAAMGQLDFSALEFHMLGHEAALVLGRWHLKRASGDIGGVFSLVFQRLPEGWRIIHDHTSSDAKPQ
jgi:ketosteroid isomerase-like protein